MDTARARTLRFIARTQARNVLGAVLSFVYFRVIDPLTSERPADAAADILISATTRASLAEAVAVTALPAARVKGRSAEVEVFAVVR